MAALAAQGHPHSPVLLDAAARTAQQAADALGVALGQIAKSIIFRRKADDVAVLVVTSGDRRVDEKKVAAQVGAWVVPTPISSNPAPAFRLVVCRRLRMRSRR